MSRKFGQLYLGGTDMTGAATRFVIFPEPFEFSSREAEYALITEYQALESGPRKKEIAALFYRACFKYMLRLSVHYAHTVGVQPGEVPDLIQECALGIFDAMKRFDTKWGVRFVTYGQYWIRTQVLHTLSSYLMRRLPYAVDQRIMQQIGYVVGAMSIAEERGMNQNDPETIHGLLQSFEQKMARMSLQKVRDRMIMLQAAGNRPREIECESDRFARPLRSDVAESLKCPSLSSRTVCLFREVHRRTIRGFNTLSRIDRLVIERRFGLRGRDPQSLAVIGREMGFSRERARQRQNRGLEQLGFTESQFRDYLRATEVLSPEQLAA
jgi:RNA polymerase sigma factor (sigma-70 family)